MIGPSSQISKILLTLLFLLIIFYVFMDIELYLRIQNYAIERNYHLNATTTAAAAGSSKKPTLAAVGSAALTTIGTTAQLLPPTHSAAAVGAGVVAAGHHLQSTKTTASVLLSNEEKLYEDYTWVSCDINPLCHVTVKAILLDHTNHYIFAPLATIFDNVIGFSRSQFITANMISFFHVGVAVAAGKLVSSDSLGYRRLGVILFQFRTFLDDLDGHVARVKKNIRGERSEVGTSGYYIDGLCDGLGCIALLIGMFVYLKNNPPRRGYTQLPMTETKLPEPVAAPKTKLTTRKIARTVMMFAGQLLMSSTAWNRYIAVYQESLEDNNVSPAVFVRQNIVFRSTWFFSVAWLWRIVNVHSMLHYVLLSIFCDKLWDFLKAIQYSGYVILVVVICFSEMHVLEAHQFICNTVFGST